MTRKATWSNSDSLVVGFGPNYAERQAAGVEKDKASVKTAKLSVDLVNSTLGSSGAKVTIPAGAAVKNVYAKVVTAAAGGTSIAFGDTNSTGGWITATQGAVANLTPAGLTIQANGAYAYTATEGQLPPKVYSSSLDLYVTAVGTFTAGKIDFYVEYV
jgi:hypothetical protein